MKKDITLTLTSLVHGKNQLHYTIPANDLGINKELKILNNAEVDLSVLKSGDKLLIDGMVNFRAEIVCSNCAETFTKNYSEPIHAEYIKNTPKLGRSVLLTHDEVDRSYFHGETLDLLPLIHDTILLAIPLAPTCREECKGICTECGVNLNLEQCQCEKTADMTR